jgi:hypothetical protein
MAKDIIPPEEIRQVRQLVGDLNNKRCFLDICRLAIRRNFLPREVDLIYADSSILSSRDQAKLLELIKLLTKIKLADFNIFIHLLSKICQQLVCCDNPLPFTSKRDGEKEVEFYLRDGIQLERRLLAYLPYCLDYIHIPAGRRYFVTNVDLQKIVGRHIGYCLLVDTGEDDEIVFGKRDKKASVTRYVIGRQPDLTHFLWLSLVVDDYSKTEGYILRNAAFGKRPPVTPDITSPAYQSLDDAEKQAVINFWRTHAYILPPNPLALKLASAPPEWEI